MKLRRRKEKGLDVGEEGARTAREGEMKKNSGIRGKYMLRWYRLGC